MVITVADGAVPARDHSLLREVPEEAEVHTTGSFDPYQLYAWLTGKDASSAVKLGSLGQESSWKETIASWLRANAFLPDARVGWVPFAAWRALQLAGNADVLVTTGPPHSSHLAGWLVHRLTGLPWLADFRDPWMDINYYQELPQHPVAARVDAALERRVLRDASAVASVSPSWCSLLGEKRGREGVVLIQNGFDPADIPDEVEQDEHMFFLTHVGSLYASRNPAALWRALRQMDRREEALNLRVRLVGSVADEVWRSIDEHRVRHRIEHISYVPHEEAARLLCRGAMAFLSIERFPQDHGMITGKLYEYLGSGRPVVGLGPADGDAAALLRETGAGRIFDRSDTIGLYDYVLRAYRQWQTGTPLHGADMERLAPYTREAQTALLAETLDGLAS